MPIMGSGLPRRVRSWLISKSPSRLESLRPSAAVSSGMWQKSGGVSFSFWYR